MRQGMSIKNWLILLKIICVREYYKSNKNWNDNKKFKQIVWAVILPWLGNIYSNQIKFMVNKNYTNGSRTQICDINLTQLRNR